MSPLTEAFSQAAALILRADSDLAEIVGLSLTVSLGATALAALIGMPIGAMAAIFRFPGRRALVVLLDALMGLPPVVAGLFVYLVLSRSGPLGFLGLLYSPLAMVIAQLILILPIVAALSRQTVEDYWREYEEQLRSLGAGPGRSLPTLLWDGRFSLFTSVLAGFGRAIAEVGAVMIVGGNIAHVTRTMTTTIALEVNKGQLALAMALGIILIALAISVNGSVHAVKHFAQRWSGQ
jgi:tungstate transport system permease protein